MSRFISVAVANRSTSSHADFDFGPSTRFHRRDYGASTATLRGHPAAHRRVCRPHQSSTASAPATSQETTRHCLASHTVGSSQVKDAEFSAYPHEHGRVDYRLLGPAAQNAYRHWHLSFAHSVEPHSCVQSIWTTSYPPIRHAFRFP